MKNVKKKCCWGEKDPINIWKKIFLLAYQVCTITCPWGIDMGSSRGYLRGLEHRMGMYYCETEDGEKCHFVHAFWWTCDGGMDRKMRGCVHYSPLPPPTRPTRPTMTAYDPREPKGWAQKIYKISALEIKKNFVNFIGVIGKWFIGVSMVRLVAMCPHSPTVQQNQQW